MEKNVCVPKKLEESPAKAGNSSNMKGSPKGGKSSSCVSTLREDIYFEAGKGRRVKVVEVYGSKPIDEVLEAFSKYIAQFL